MSDLFEILSSVAGPAQHVGGTKRPHEASPRFETDGSAQMLFVGYTSDEVIALMAAYREHVNLMMAQAKSFQQEADAVRYRPDRDGE